MKSIVQRLTTSPGVCPSLVAWFRLALLQLALTWQTIQSRRLLAELNERMRADIGISLADAQIEANRRFWERAPSNREHAP